MEDGRISVVNAMGWGCAAGIACVIFCFMSPNPTRGDLLNILCSDIMPGVIGATVAVLAGTYNVLFANESEIVDFAAAGVGAAVAYVLL